MSSSRNGPVPPAERPLVAGPGQAGGHELDIERDSDVPISTQIYWQLAYQIESGRLQPATRLPPVRELGAALRVNPNTVRAVYRRLADAGYVVGRHGAGTRVVDRPPVRRGGQALAGIVAETLRRAAQLGFTPDEVAQAVFTATTERKRPGPHVRVLFAECTTADANVDAERISEAFPDRVEVIPVLLDEIPERLARYHYDLVATTTFHADEAQAYVAGRVPVVAMLAGPGYMSLIHEISGLPSGSRVGVVCGSQRGVENIAEVLSLAGASGVELISAVAHTEPELDRVNGEANLILLSREAMALGLDARFDQPERIREWTYEFDPAAFELLRRAIERVAPRAVEGSGQVDAVEPV
jgi:GntR family transcriptional regulator